MIFGIFNEGREIELDICIISRINALTSFAIG